jgi:DNA-binding transcriptional ArsR family regulator
MKKASFTLSDELLEALFDPTNMEIVQMLAEGSMTGAEIAASLSMEDPDAVEQLEGLVEVGVLKRETGGRGSIYSLAHTNFATMADLMEQVISDRARDDIDEPEEPDKPQAQD